MSFCQNTHSCLRFLLILAQCFGMFPVSGIMHHDFTFLKFSWKSKRTIYSIVFASGAAFNIGCQIWKLATMDTLQFEDFVTLLFFACTFFTLAIFIHLAKVWPKLMKDWAKVDAIMEGYYGFPKNLNRKLKIISALVMLSAAIEHCLFLVHTAKYSKSGGSPLETLDIYFRDTRYNHIFGVVPYNTVFGFVAQILNMFSTFSWNFMDLFIMVISLTLSSRIRQINEQIWLLANNKVVIDYHWRKVREDYTRLGILCSVLDKTISNVILLSFANNLFVILVQLFNSVQPSQFTASYLDKVYFSYSFSFLLIRTVAVALYGATIDSESRRPIYEVCALPHRIYNIETMRLIAQAKYDSYSLTAHNLFKVRKSIIFSMAGAIVTYELILMQFHSF